MLEVEALQHLVDDLFLVGRVVGSAVLPAVHIGCGSGENLSCWVRTVTEARDENRDTRQGCSTASVPPLESNRNVEKATWFSGLSVRPLPGACLLVSWLCGRPWPLAFCSGSVCGSGPVVCSWPCFVVWFRPPGLFQKEATTQGNDTKTGFVLTVQSGLSVVARSEGRRPEDRSFGRYPFLRTSLQRYWWWLLGTYFGLFRGIFFLRLLLFRSSVQTHRRGLVEEPPRVERVLSVEVVPVSYPFLLMLFREVTHGR